VSIYARPGSYDDACQFHATAQGLDPITEALRAAGIPHAVDQTGGFCMCVNVPLREGGSPFLYVTAGSADGLCMVGMYWDCEECYGECAEVADDLPIDHLPHSVRLLIRAPEAMLACPHA
jgi:hypothetical protein